MVSSASKSHAGQMVGGRYELTAVIAAGGMAEVWEGRDTVLDRRVAIKLLHQHLLADSTFVDRFHSEAVAAARLTDPSIVSIYDTCREDGVEAIVMELIEGMTLRQYLDQFRVVDAQAAVDMAIAVADALTTAHQAGVVHRDIKPGNILLCDDRRVKVTDFGIARATGSSDLTEPGSIIGTPKYLAPEQIEGAPVDGRTDIYALGAVLYEALCGKPPFEADTETAMVLARLHRDPLHPRQIRPELSSELEDIILSCLSRAPSDRPPSTESLRAALHAVRDKVIDPDAPPPSDRSGDDEDEDDASFARTERRWLVPTLVIILVAGALATAGILLGGTDAGRDVVRRAREVVGAEPADESAADPEPTAPPLTAPVSDGTISVTGAFAFDPLGSGPTGENDAAAAFAVDGSLDTIWQTEGYNDRFFGNLKSGVGLYVELADTSTINEVLVDSPTVGWAVDIYASTTAGNMIEDWGSPVASANGISGDTSITFEDTEARYVLLWITDLGDAPPRVRVQIAEVSLR